MAISRRSQITETENFQEAPNVIRLEELYTPEDLGSRALVTFGDGRQVEVHDTDCTGGDPDYLEALLKMAEQQQIYTGSPNYSGMEGRSDYSSRTGILNIRALGPENTAPSFVLNAHMQSGNPDLRLMIEALRARYVPKPGVWLVNLELVRRDVNGINIFSSNLGGTDFPYSSKLCFHGQPVVRPGVTPYSYIPHGIHVLSEAFGLCVVALLPRDRTQGEPLLNWAKFVRELDVLYATMSEEPYETQIAILRELYNRIYLES